LIAGDQTNSKLLAKVLVDHHPRKSLIQELVMDLTSSSLQSKEELLKVASYFNIPSLELTNDFDLLSTIFDARNQIVHEMDIDFSQTNWKRRSRTRADMLKYTNEILRVAKVFLQKVDTKLNRHRLIPRYVWS
jgi:predicted GTPase